MSDLKWIGKRVSWMDHPQKTTVAIYPRITPWKQWALRLWALSWTFVGVVVSMELAKETDRDRMVMLGVFMGFWIYFEYIAIKALMWREKGVEMLKFNTEGMTIKNSLFGFGKARMYYYQNVQKLGVVEKNPTSLQESMANAYWTKGTDCLGFNYNSRKVGFAKDLDEKDTVLLLRIVNERIKVYSKMAKKQAKEM